MNVLGYDFVALHRYHSHKQISLSAYGYCSEIIRYDRSRCLKLAAIHRMGAINYAKGHI